MKYRGLIFVFCCLFAVPAFAQMTGSEIRTGPNGAINATLHFNPSPAYYIRPIVGAPYSALQVSEQSQTLPDGTNISQRHEGQRMYRDSAGRTRMERPFIMSSPPNSNSPLKDLMIIEIRDSVAGYMYYLDTFSKVAHRVALPPAPQPPVPGATAGVRMGGSAGVTGGFGVASAAPSGTVLTPPVAAPQQDRPKIVSEKLPQQMVEGVMCDGRRTTVTYPAGAMGNDRPITTINESWMSPELQLTVMTKSSDPRYGDRIMRMENLSRAEPDVTLFQVPPDFTLVDETGPFTIKITRP